MATTAHRSALALPGVGGALLAKAACPACWTLLAPLFGSLGLGAVELGVGTLRLLGAGFLLLALAALAWRAPRRHGYSPLALGVLAAGALWIGEHLLPSEPLAFAGVGLLIIASAWNAWPRRVAPTDGCGACAPVHLQR